MASLSSLLFRTALVLPVLTACQPSNSVPSVSLEQARDALQNSRAMVFDIREAHEHATGVAAGAKLLPMSQLAQRSNEIPRDASKPVYLICNTQNRSLSVTKALQEQGYTHVSYVNGGMSAWARQGWPLVKPQ